MSSDDSNGVCIRPAVSDDADGIAHVFAESAAHHARLDSERYWIPETSAIAARYRNEPQVGEGVSAATTVVAVLHGEIVGFVEARVGRTPDPMHRDLLYCYIDEIAVIGKHRNRGTGGRLLRAAEDWGRRKGATFAYLEYHVDNLRAGEFYQRRMGYRIAACAAIRRL